MNTPPQNPTGKVLDEEELGFIAELCRAYDRFAISDEIYEHITFDGHRHRCLARCEGMAERTLVVNSISKTGRATGWRVGWVITPPDRTPALRAVHDNLVVQAPTPLQKGAVSLLRQPRSFFSGIAEGYRQKRDLLVGGLREIGFSVTPPEGAYYLFADYHHVPALAAMSPTQAAMFLIEKAGWRRCRATTSTPSDARESATCDSPSAARSRHWRQASNGSARGFASEWQSPDRLRG